MLLETRLTVRDAAMKQWAMNLVEEQHINWTKLFDDRMVEREGRVTGRRNF